MRVIRDKEVAKSTLLKRLPFESPPISAQMKQRIKEVFAEELDSEGAVKRVISEVRARGDVALFNYTKKLDGVELRELEVSREEIVRSYTQVKEELISALNLAAQRVRSFHAPRWHQSWVEFGEGGLGQLIRPLERVGIYVPGGTASYPSAVLMTAIPAKMAGVEEIIMTTPPQEGGIISPAILVAADIAQVDRIFKLGGAQAIAALAFGTESIPRVDKICGPGNIFVLLAKRLLYGVVDIDGLYGPTETVIIADGTASPSICAADLIAQSEHDVLASAILITTSSELADEVNQEVERQLAELQRRQIATESLEASGGIIVVDSVKEAIELVNYYAPEHLSLMVKDSWSYLSKIKNAGGIFLGESSAEALGDYIAGPSHVMPTGGTARFSSPLNLAHFFKVTSLVALDKEALSLLGPPAATIARSEGLEGHARALEARLKDRKID